MNCLECHHRIGVVCMKHAILMQYGNGLPANESDKEYLRKISPCETGKGGTQYELKRNVERRNR